MMHNIERFYKHRKKSISYIKRHCMFTQEPDVEDIYHEALIIADRRKNTDNTREDGLCLFSGYSTALRSGSHSDWHYKYDFVDYEREFTSQSDPLFRSQIDICEESFSLDLISESMALIMIFCKHLRPSINISLSFFFGEYSNMSKMGDLCGLSRERIRQLRNSSIVSIRSLSNEILEAKASNVCGPFFMLPIDHFEYYSIMEMVPLHLTFSELRKSSDGDFSLSFLKYLKVLSVFFEDVTADFDFAADTKYKGLIMNESMLVSKDVFMCLDPSPLTLYYHHNSEVFEIGWLRELFARFVKGDKGWYDEASSDEGDEIVFYDHILEIVDQVVMDYISENFELEDYTSMERDLDDKFLKFFR
jgi:hypothetical protein